MHKVQPGDRINNYIIESSLGSGSFGEVWKAVHHVFRDPVAIKIPSDPQYVRALQREGAAIHGLNHPNIVRAFDLDPYSTPPYLIMEFVDGPTLAQAIAAQPSGLETPAVTAILTGILEALCCAHENHVIHRDIKPCNILLATGQGAVRDIAPEQVKVSDFGLGIVGDVAQSMLQSGSMSDAHAQELAGTIAYMAPEQRDGQPVDARCDLYSVGVVLFEMLTGTRPQGRDLPSQLRNDLPAWFDELFVGCYTRRDQRFEHAAALLSLVRKQRQERREPNVNRYQSCDECGRFVDGSDHFCIHCGKQLADRLPRCASCGTIAQASDQYCIRCGDKLACMN